MSNLFNSRQRIATNISALQRSGSSDNILAKPGEIQGIRKRPGSESDILEKPNPLHHIDSLQLGHHRPGIVSHRVTNLNTSRQIKPVFIWTKPEVMKWLRKHVPTAFSTYAEQIEKHEITGRTLLSLNDAKLQRIGIQNSNIRKQFMYEILKLRMKNHMNTFKGLETG